MKINVACPQCNFYVPLTMPIEKHTSYGQCACGIKVEVRLEDGVQFVDFLVEGEI